MIQAWIESVVIKRAILALAAGIVAQLTAHLIPDLSPALNWLAHIGISASITVSDPTLLRESLVVFFMAGTQAAHEWAAAKFPELAKWI